MNALYSLSNVAWEARISRSELERIITPCPAVMELVADDA